MITTDQLKEVRAMIPADRKLMRFDGDEAFVLRSKEGDGEEDVKVVQLDDDGSWMVAEWHDQAAEWQSQDLPEESQFPGYRYTHAKTLEGLRAEGIRTYTSPAAAFRAVLASEATL